MDDRRVDEVCVYGVLSGFKEKHIHAVIELLIQKSLLMEEFVASREGKSLPVLAVTAQGRDFLAGHRAVEVAFVQGFLSSLPVALSEEARLRFERLRKLRLDIAKRDGVAAFRVCHDSVLREIARVKPSTLEEMAAIRGIGDKFMERHAEEFLRALTEEGIADV